MKIERCKLPTKYWNWITFSFTKRIKFTIYFSWKWCLDFQIGINLHGVFISFSPFSFHFDWYYRTTKEILGISNGQGQ